MRSGLLQSMFSSFDPTRTPPSAQREGNWGERRLSHALLGASPPSQAQSDCSENDCKDCGNSSDHIQVPMMTECVVDRGLLRTAVPRHQPKRYCSNCEQACDHGQPRPQDKETRLRSARKSICHDQKFGFTRPGRKRKNELNAYQRNSAGSPATAIRHLLISDNSRVLITARIKTNIAKRKINTNE